MALVANTWYIVSFTTPIPANNPPWDTSLFPSLPTGILNAILTATNLLVFCVATDGTTVQLAYDGGFAPSIPRWCVHGDLHAGHEYASVADRRQLVQRALGCGLVVV